jgi:hypothetical protein
MVAAFRGEFEEESMKSLIILSVVLCALILGSVSFNSTAAAGAKKQRAVVNFDAPVMLQGVVLQGKFLFIHDDAAMSRGESCTFVYRGEAEVANKLVASFHCIPVQRAKAKHFVTRSVQTASGAVELREYQFDGDTEAHGVPPLTVR